MDYRRAWYEVKIKLEESLEEGQVNGYDKQGDTRVSGMYEAFKRVLDHMEKLESEEVKT